MRKAYSSDLTDAQWKLIKPVFGDQRRYAKHSPRQIVNALFYILKTGCQWRMLPNDFAPWKTVYYHFRKWRESGRIECLCTRLRRAARVKAGRQPSPSAAVIDSQSVPTARQGGLQRSYDGGKQVKGRKRHVVTDTMGLLLGVFVLGVFVCGAGHHDSQKAPRVLQRLLGTVGPRLKVIFADKGYDGGVLKGLVWRSFGWLLEVVRRGEDAKGFEPIPKRWVIERTFGWFASWRRLSRDYEYLPETSEAMIRLGMSRLMISRLA